MVVGRADTLQILDGCCIGRTATADPMRSGIGEQVVLLCPGLKERAWNHGPDCFLAFSCVPAATTVMLDRQRVPGWTGCTCGGGGVAAVWCWRGRRGLDSFVFTDLSPFLVERGLVQAWVKPWVMLQSDCQSSPVLMRL